MCGLYCLVVSLVLSQLLSLSFAYNNTTWLQVDQLRYKFLELENSLWTPKVNSLLRRKPIKAETFLKKKFAEFDEQLQKIPSNLLLGMDGLKSQNEFIFLCNNLAVIDVKYIKFRHYLQQQTLDLHYKIYKEEIIYDLLNNETGINVYKSAIYKLAYGPGNSLFQKLIQVMTFDPNKGLTSWIPVSPLQAYYRLYNSISLHALKAYILEQFAYLARTLNKGNFVQSSENARKEFENNTLMIYQQLRNTLDHSYRVITGTPTWKKGIDYDEFTGLVQGRIVEERELNNGRCSLTCGDFSGSVYNRPSCRGRLHDCFLFDTWFDICESESGSKRYNYIKGNYNGKIYGRNPNQVYCSRKYDWYSWNWWIFFRCDYCMCLCDEKINSDRYISLRSVKSDVKQNMVITGLRFVKYNGILHLQIQEGKLIPYGEIDQKSVRWKPVDNFKITDYNVRKNSDYFEMNSSFQRMALNEPTAYGLDFHVMTGVSFSYIDRQIRLKVYVAPFEWPNATLFTSKTKEIYRTYTTLREKYMPLFFSNVPNRCKEPLKSYHLSDNNYLEFTHSGWETDVAQSTIPFIDMMAVYSIPAVPLKGAGIYYKGGNGCAGIIAPMIKTYVHLNLLSNTMPPILYRSSNFTVNNVNKKK